MYLITLLTQHSFLRRPRIYHLGDDFRRFTQQYSLPAALWEEGGNGSVGQRKAYSEAAGQSHGEHSLSSVPAVIGCLLV
jgi:hypothetical protein